MKNFLKKTSLITLFILLATSGSPVFAQEEVEYDYTPTFSDVTQKSGDIFGNIEYLAHIGVIEGYSDGSFGRWDYINRAEMMKIIVEGLGYSPDEQEYRNCFPDVRMAWYAKYVCFAEEKGWIDGYEDGFFYPEKNVTNAQATKMVINAFFAEEVDQQNPEELANGTKNFKDVDIVDWYRPYAALKNNKLFQRFNSSWFGPNFYITRGGVVDLFFRAMMVSEQNLEVYHKYFRDEFFKENDLEHFIVGQTICYEFWPTFDAPYLWDYVNDEYGISERPARNADFYGSEGPDQFPYFDPGYFCPLDDGGMLFSNSITYDKQGAERHLMRFNGEGELLQDDGFECEEDKKSESFFYDNRDIVKAFGLKDIDPETFNLLSCDYAKDKNLVYYGFGSSSSDLYEADPETFEYIGGFYGKDKNQVYYGNWRMDKAELEFQTKVGVDVETFQVISGDYAKDKDRVYSKNTVVKNQTGLADLQTFEVLSGNYATDQNHVYYLGSAVPSGYEVVEITPDEFEVLGGGYAIGKHDSYYKGKELSTGGLPLDLNTFEILERGYVKDVNHVYYQARELIGADPITFEVFDFPYSRDKNNVYQRERKIEGANPQAFKFLDNASLFSVAKDDDQIFRGYDEFTEEEIIEKTEDRKEYTDLDDFVFKGLDVESFEALGANYYRDKNHVYHSYKGVVLSLMEKADRETFSVVEEYLPDPFARDKNHVYCGSGIRSDDPENFDYAAIAKDCPWPDPGVTFN